MAEADQGLEYLLVWWGENALDSEIEFWQHIKTLDAYRQAHAFIEVFTQEEADKCHVQLEAEGWRLSTTGSGMLRRVSTYIRMI